MFTNVLITNRGEIACRVIRTLRRLGVASVMVHAPTRTEAVAQLRAALDGTRVAGIESNVEYLRTILDEPTFALGRTTTRFLGTLAFAPRAIEVLKAGTQTTVQDHPGRLEYWAIGVPPSGPMDGLAFRLANRASSATRPTPRGWS